MSGLSDVAALDAGLRGGAVGLLLLIAVIGLRDRPFRMPVFLGAALAVTAAASAIAPLSAPSGQARWWSAPLVALPFGGSVLFWLWARAQFDDDFVARPWHAALWAVIVGLGLFIFYDAAAWPSPAVTIASSLSLTALVLALLAGAQTLRTWANDLVAGRRRLRAVVLIGTLIYIALIASSDLSALVHWKAGFSVGSFERALGLCLLAATAALMVLRARPTEQMMATASAGAEVSGGRPGEDGERAAVAPALLKRLEQEMTVERAYRQAGLTIGSLAAKLAIPEYRLRQVINEGLGHRNFNAFLNRYRIDEAKLALGDATQKEVPVLTIAMDAGFQSIGPFNRAFKAQTGLTPTEFRRVALSSP